MSKCNMNYGVDILIFKGTWSGQTVEHRQAGITFTSSWFARSCSEGSCEMCSSACRDVSRLSRGRIRGNFHTSHIAFDHATAPLTLDWYLYTLYLIIHISLFLGLLFKLNWLACCKLTSHFSGCFSTLCRRCSCQYRPLGKSCWIPYGRRPGWSIVAICLITEQTTYPRIWVRIFIL